MERRSRSPAERLPRRVGSTAEAWLIQQGFPDTSGSAVRGPWRRGLRFRAMEIVSRWPARPGEAIALPPTRAIGPRADGVGIHRSVSVDLEGLGSAGAGDASIADGSQAVENRSTGTPGIGVRSSVANAAGVSRRKRRWGEWRPARSSSLMTGRHACSGMVWSPQVNTSTAAVSRFQARCESTRCGLGRDSGQQSQALSRPGDGASNRWVIRLWRRVAPARFAAVVMAGGSQAKAHRRRVLTGFQS